MKWFFLVFESTVESRGISKKIQSQISALKELGIDVSFSDLGLDDDLQYDKRMVDGKLLESYRNQIVVKKRWQWRIRFKKIEKYIFKNDIKILYIRYTHFANPFFISFLKKMKQNNIFVILEIPTFPYDAEYNDVKWFFKIGKFIEEYYRVRFKNVVDLIVTYSEESFIFGVNTIKINNGIDLSMVPLTIRNTGALKVEYNFIAVASMEFWHGYDRIIEGLSQYYLGKPRIKVILHLVGNSTNKVANGYKLLVQKYGLEKYVFFHGFKAGNQLNELFNLSDLAIGCLGVHRKGISSIKSLKNSEYCARGIPFVYSEIDDTFDQKQFVLKVPPDESNIKIDELIAFLRQGEHRPEEIRNVAEQTLSWKMQMKKIIDRITILKS